MNLTKELYQKIKSSTLNYSNYNCYPLISKWNGNLNQDEWFEDCSNSINEKNSKLSLYIHIPFCKTLCTHCACNTFITSDQSIEEDYINALLLELDFYLNSIPNLKNTPLHQLYIGGGTPNFISAKNLDKLYKTILNKLNINKNFESTIEIDPRYLNGNSNSNLNGKINVNSNSNLVGNLNVNSNSNLNESINGNLKGNKNSYLKENLNESLNNDQIKVFAENNVNRIRLGIEDLNPKVQKIINKNFNYEDLKKQIENIKINNIKNIDFDLIYGLPFQTPLSISKSLFKLISLNPNRIYLNEFINVPSKFTNQKLFSKIEFENNKKIFELYNTCKTILLKSNYFDLGHNTFVLKDDKLFKAYENQKLNINFMGLTQEQFNLNLGLGVSAVSENLYSYYQNSNILKTYINSVKSKIFTSEKSHKFTHREIEKRNLFKMAYNEKKVKLEKNFNTINTSDYEKLISLEKENCITLRMNELTILEKGFIFIPNICKILDNL